MMATRSRRRLSKDTTKITKRGKTRHWLLAGPSQARRICLCAVLVLFLLSATAAAYDPLVIASGFALAQAELTVHDPGRSRSIPLRVYLPSKTTPAPVLLFSHGLGGSREGSSYLGVHWAARGYVAVFVQHPGSDVSVWKDKPMAQALQSMQQAAGANNYFLRVKDVPVVLDQLEGWNKAQGHVLAGRLDVKRVGMSGHSFGAVTTQAVSGQCDRNGKQMFTEPRIKAALALSPSSPKAGSPDQAFGKVKVPWMVMTGTKDVSIIGDTDLQSRLAVFPALPPGGKYELVLHGAEHSAFTDRPLSCNGHRNPNHHRVILALSTAFWDAWLGQDAGARAWLDSKGPASVLQTHDRWQAK